MKRAFISRQVKEQDAFRLMLEAEGVDVIGKSLINFSRIVFEYKNEFDWLFFYSKNGVKYFFEQQPDVKNIRLAALGQATARQMLDYGYTADYIGSGKPDLVAYDFLEHAKGQKVLFAQAFHSKQSIQNLLSGQIESQAVICYKNEMKTDFEVPTCDYLVFTSPLNAKAYFKKYQILENQKVIAIGHTTEAALYNCGLSSIIVAEKPTEISLAQTVIHRLS